MCCTTEEKYAIKKCMFFLKLWRMFLSLQSENADVTFQSLVSWCCWIFQGLKTVICKNDKWNISVCKASRIHVDKEKI